MSVVSWNYRGLRNPCIVKALQKLVLEEDPTLVFLMETKFVVSEIALIKHKLDWQQSLVVPSVRCGGGLALLWKSSIKVDVQTYLPRHINLIVIEEQSKKQWRFTGFYGHPKTNKRLESWRLLEELSTRSSLPWICMGDFNEIMQGREREGGNTLPKWQMNNFCEAVNRSNLRDIGYIGSDFTWCRRLGNCGWVRERLDRALVSTSWASTFPKENSRDTEKASMSGGGECNNNVLDEIQETKMELNKILLVEEDIRQQRSRNCWLKSGDRNTTFFHTKASNRHQRNIITRIKDANNVWLEEEEIMRRTFVEYFTELFTSSQVDVSVEVLEVVQSKVTDRMNSLLLQEFQAHDVEKALK
ncbi:uncharacterized protein LOC142612050 [Castanea sativa]|uniref:uncharacterized protein LOC142612050 n=1 Tax=Castanea sativa TaxID=21020 RepID=UPI003F650A6D